MIVFNTFKEFKEKFPNQDPNLIKAIIEESNLFIGNRLLAGDDYLMPHNLGMIFIGKFKTKKVFDYIHFCKTGEFKQQNNIRTYNYLYKIIWFKGLINKRSKTLNNNLYKFHASRYKIRRPLAKILKGGNDFYKNEEYIERFYYKNGYKAKI